MAVAATEKAEVVVIGAGLIGSAVAMYLAKLGVSSVRVIDVDLEGALSSSELNAGGVRATLSNPVNILLSMQSIDYFAKIRDEIGYRDCGYLWLRSAEQMPRAEKSRELQTSLGWKVESWDLAELRRRVPFIDKTDGIAGAHFGPRDGLINPNLLKLHFRTGAAKLGVRFDDRTRLKSAEVSATGVKLRCDRFAALDTETRQVLMTGGDAPASASIVEYQADRVVNCAGPWAAQVAKILGYSCPSEPYRRQIAIFDCRDVDLSPYGMIVDTSGVYFHPEATNGLAGVSTHEKAGFNFQYDGQSFFEELIWPALYERSTAFEKLRHLTGWAGLYEVSPDHSAIIGDVTDRIFEAHSFSGHGAMQSPAAGLGLAERIVSGRYQTIDLKELSGKRFEEGRLVSERAVI